MSDPLRFIAHYDASLQQQIAQLVAENRLQAHLAKRYPEFHHINNNGQLYEYAKQIKQQFMKNVKMPDVVCFDAQISRTERALGIQRRSIRQQGSQLKSKTDIRIASVFQRAPEAFLNMIVVHELAHLKQSEHDKAFYQLCQHMLPQYHQLEFDTRLWLMAMELPQASYWDALLEHLLGHWFLHH